ARGLQRVQKQSFAGLKGEPVPKNTAVNALEHVMGQVVGDTARHVPTAANLLSGGVDSSYIQALWNKECSETPVSFSMHVDHPLTRMDTEYALSSAKALGVRHTLVPTDAPVADYLIETIAQTAEPPNHVMAAYFGRLARAMVERGYTLGLCGEG